MHRLYIRIYLALLASLLVLALAAGTLWHFFGRELAGVPSAGSMAEIVAELLPAGATPEQQAQTLERWSRRVRADLTLADASGHTIASAGPVVEKKPGAGSDEAVADETTWWEHDPFGVHLADGRTLLVRRHWRGQSESRPHWGALPGIAVPLVILALVVAVTAFPVVRKLTRRLERLARAVDALGAGDLKARVPVHGHDEVAQLARRFNRSAERIETLVQSNRTLLANASHELRSPLARMRMAIGMLPADVPRGVAEEIQRDIVELDTLIDEILLASRLDAGPALVHETVDLVAILAEECARVDIAIVDDVEPETRAGGSLVDGDARLLRRMVRNLLENARRHAGAAPAEAALKRTGDAIALSVCDRGPGVPVDERERIFQPFYRARGASERDGGVGLGLSLVQKIVELHGGSVRCMAREGGGACFVVTMPIAPRR